MADTDQGDQGPFADLLAEFRERALAQQFGPAATEPRAEIRAATALHAELVAGWIEHGFTRSEALFLLVNVIAINSGGR